MLTTGADFVDVDADAVGAAVGAAAAARGWRRGETLLMFLSLHGLLPVFRGLLMM
jgi:hypothetical protein